jgi:predicted glycoside hydrolase/deacetylase ChbG (UPF0249 family)
MTEAVKSTVILCADDFGISAGVNRAIVDLAAQGRLSAVSCMSCGEAWAAGAQALKATHASIDVGLHLTLTALMPLTKEWGARFPTKKTIILKSWLRTLDKELVEKEIRAQFSAFIGAWGAPPDFIDGHQHVHVLPVIRDILLKVRAEYAPHAWMRNVADPTAVKENFKHRVLAVLGWRWRKMLEERGIPHNKMFRGAYDFTKPADYAALMGRWCATGEPLLIYCHPGFPDATLAKIDTVLEPRRKEYEFFSSGAFRDHLDKHEVELIRRPS